MLPWGRSEAQVSSVSICGELVVKNLPANAGDIRDTGSIPGSEQSPGEANDNPLQYSWLKNSMDRGAWRAAVQSHKELDTTEAT